jgi:hypothetical protein
MGFQKVVEKGFNTNRLPRVFDIQRPAAKAFPRAAEFSFLNRFVYPCD